MVGRTDQPTAAQSARMSKIKKMHCVACDIDGNAQPNRTEVHHLVDKGTRALSGGHDATCPLCMWHHRGVAIRGLKPAQMEAQYGPSMALRGRAFTARYGTQRELLAITDERLKQAEAA